MKWTLPGTTLTVEREDSKFIEQQLSSMFFGGGIVLSQVSAVTGLEPYTVQNWVKRGFLPAPEHKRYNMNLPGHQHQYAEKSAAHGADLWFAHLHQR